MIKHVVMWKLKDTLENSIENAVSALRAMEGKIPNMQSIQVGKNLNPKDTAFDIVLINTFETMEELEKYQSHPEHLKVKDYIANVTKEGAVVDFEF